MADTEWVRHYDSDSACYYYHNAFTGESRWDPSPHNPLHTSDDQTRASSSLPAAASSPPDEHLRASSADSSDEEVIGAVSDEEPMVNASEFRHARVVEATAQIMCCFRCCLFLHRHGGGGGGGGSAPGQAT